MSKYFPTLDEKMDFLCRLFMLKHMPPEEIESQIERDGIDGAIYLFSKIACKFVCDMKNQDEYMIISKRETYNLIRKKIFEIVRSGRYNNQPRILFCYRFYP